MADWIKQERKGLYHSADGTRRLLFGEDIEAWWITPMHKRPDQAGFSLGECKGPYRIAADAGTIDQPAALGHWTYQKEDQ